MKEYSVLDYNCVLVILVLIHPLEIYIYVSVSTVFVEKCSFRCVKWNILDLIHMCISQLEYICSSAI